MNLNSMKSISIRSLLQRILLPLASLCFSLLVVQVNAAPSPQADLQDALQQIELGKLPVGWKALKGDWGVRLDQQFAPEGVRWRRNNRSPYPGGQKQFVATIFNLKISDVRF